jgi:hypothetical protein
MLHLSHAGGGAPAPTTRGARAAHLGDQDAGDGGHGGAGVHQLSLLVPAQRLRVGAQVEGIEAEVAGQAARGARGSQAASQTWRGACALSLRPSHSRASRRAGVVAWRAGSASSAMHYVAARATYVPSRWAGTSAPGIHRGRETANALTAALGACEAMVGQTLVLRPAGVALAARARAAAHPDRPGGGPAGDGRAAEECHGVRVSECGDSASCVPAAAACMCCSRRSRSRSAKAGGWSPNHLGVHRRACDGSRCKDPTPHTGNARTPASRPIVTMVAGRACSSPSARDQPRTTCCSAQLPAGRVAHTDDVIQPADWRRLRFVARPQRPPGGSRCPAAAAPGIVGRRGCVLPSREPCQLQAASDDIHLLGAPRAIW